MLWDVRPEVVRPEVVCPEAVSEDNLSFQHVRDKYSEKD